MRMETSEQGKLHRVLTDSNQNGLSMGPGGDDCTSDSQRKLRMDKTALVGSGGGGR